MAFKCVNCKYHNIKELKCDIYNQYFQNGYEFQAFSNLHCEKREESEQIKS